MTESGLRERKKARTRAAIQEHALRLFREQGYTETTVDQIAAAADVSPATFFRYFPTKEDAVLFDAVDRVMMDVFRTQPPELTVTAALRAAFRQGYAKLTPEQLRTERERHQLFAETPELRSRILEQYQGAIDMLGGLAAERTGRSPDDIAVRAWAGAVVGVVMATSYFPGDAGLLEDSVDLVDAGLAQLEAGLPL